MSKILSCAVVAASFPFGTTEEAFQFNVTGVNTTVFKQSFSNSTNSLTVGTDQLPPGDYTYNVSKNGQQSQESDVFTVSPVAISVTFSVPDTTQKASPPTDA